MSSSALGGWRAAALACLLTTVAASPARAGKVSVAAAADLTYCLQDLDAAFTREHPGTDVQVSTGSSGNFFAQIQNGAPFDVFLSADVRYPQQLIEAKAAVADTLFIYAAGKLVLWTKNDALDLGRGLEILRDPGVVRTLAIANPDHAPYGRAAKAALEKAGLWSGVESRLVVADNIAQTAQFVESGNADAGLVALALVVSPKLKGVGHYVSVDPALYPRLDQAAVLTQHGSDQTEAKAYLDFLRSETARAIFDRYGFTMASGG